MLTQVKRTGKEWEEVLQGITHGYIAFGNRSKMYDSGMGQMARLKCLDVWKEGDRILDLACGNGRLTIPLTEADVTYVGIDCVAGSIDWCRKAFEPWPQFTFQHYDIWNGFYNPSGVTIPSKVKFMLDDESFDSIICSSIFTHIGTMDACVAHLDEVYRLLKPGGKVWMTWFRSPPNEINSGCERTVFYEADIINLVRRFKVTYTNSGFSDTWHDQWEMVLEKD
mgnify:FL=1